MTPEEAKRQAVGLIADNQIDFEEAVAELLMLREKRPAFMPDRSLLKAQEQEQQFRAEAAAALRELRAKLDSMMFNERHATPFTAIQKAQVELNATIAALGLADEAQEGER